MSIWFRPITLEDCTRLDAGMGERHLDANPRD